MIILKDNIHFEALYRIYTSNSLLLINISDIVVTIVHEMHQFTEAQEAAIILQFGELKHATLVRRWFLKEYPDIPHHHVPVDCQFSRIRDRFLKTNWDLGGEAGQTAFCEEEFGDYF